LLNLRDNPTFDQDACSIYIPLIFLNNPGIRFLYDQNPCGCETPAYFSDANLKAAVETALRKTDPTPTNMLRLTYLHACEIGVTSLAGLEYATNLAYLNLNNNNVTDISPLASLTNLDRLWLGDNSIIDVNALTGLTHLTDLDLWGNSITDVSPLVGLTNLDRLWLGGNNITDISPLASLTNLTKLYLWDNSVADITSLAGLTSLTDLDLGNNSITDISPLAGLTSLTWLYLWSNSIIDISPLAGLTNLTELQLWDNSITDISPLAGLTNLTKLYLYLNSISDISPLAGLTNLTVLRIRSNNFTDISPLAGLTNLTMLDLYGNSLTDISPLASLLNLTWLKLQNNSITDISALTGLTNLTWLRLGDNPLDRDAYCYDLQAIIDSNPGLVFLRFNTLNTNPPEGVSASDGTFADKVQITWEALCPAPGRTDTFQYMVYRSGSLGGAKEAISGWLTTTSFNDTAASVGTHYYYWVTSNYSTTFSNANEGWCATYILYVDDDQAGDPNSDGTAEHPLGTIQQAIDEADNGCTIIVKPGIYYGTIDFSGKPITIMRFEPNIPAILSDTIIDANELGTAVTFNNGEDSNSVLNGFTVTHGHAESAGGIYCYGSSPTICNCLIVGNRAYSDTGGGVYCVDSNAIFENCTISGNYASLEGAGLYLCDSNVVIVNSIIWDNLPQEIETACGLGPVIAYSDIGGSWPEQGNIGADPCFINTGYWDLNGTPEDPNDDLWVDGDYHLKSQAGRWDPNSQSWVVDGVTSPCIDTGDPNSPVGNEPAPNGNRINMGAYGGTPEASISLSTEPDVPE